MMHQHIFTYITEQVLSRCIGIRPKKFLVRALHYSVLSDDGRGVAFYDCSLNHYCMFKITSEVSVMSLELFGISEALTYALSKNIKKIVIFSDSKSALQSIIRCGMGNRGVSITYTILGKNNKCLKSDTEVRLQWVPSHIGLFGNKEAKCYLHIFVYYFGFDALP